MISGHFTNGLEGVFENIGEIQNGEVKYVKKDCSSYTFISNYDVTYYSIDELKTILSNTD